MNRTRNESGTAIVEFVWLAILLIVPMLYIVLAAFDTQRAAYAASAAARSAGRAFVTAPDQATGRSQAPPRPCGWPIATSGSTTCPTSGSPAGRTRGNCLSPGSVARAEVHSSVDLPLMPAALGSNTPAIRVDADHEALHGTFREARR